MREPIIYVVVRVFYYNTTPFVCLLDGEVLVPVKRVEALEFLLEKFGYVGGMERAERDVFVKLMYCSSLGLEIRVGSSLICL